MVQKSYGKMHRTRKKMTSNRGKLGLTAYIRTFDNGDKVHIDMVPSSPIQHPRFDGATGTVAERRGRNYVVEILDGSKTKKIFLRPEHMKLQEVKG